MVRKNHVKNDDYKDMGEMKLIERMAKNEMKFRAISSHEPKLK